jgi:hypothetical protein
MQVLVAFGRPSLGANLTNCATMAEGGGIGPRSSKGTAAYKAAPSSQLVALRSGKTDTHHGPCQCFPHKNPGRGLRVIAQLHGDAVMEKG